MPDRIEALVRSTGRRGGGTLVVGLSAGGERTIVRWSPRARALPEPPVFEIGSLTKPLTGALLADMHLRGELRLDDPLAAHLPDAAAWPVGEVTLAQLATHRSGLPNTPRRMLPRELAVLAGIRGRDPWESVGEDDYRALVAGARRRSLGRRGLRYSSMGFGLLGGALACRAGRPYGELLRERLLEPLAMQATTVHGATSLPGRSRRGRRRPPMHDRMPAAGGVRSTVPDLLRWLEACLRPPDDPPGPALALARRPHASIARRIELGLGWIVQSPRRRPTTVWHNGLTYGFRSFGAFVPDAGGAVVALASTTRPLERLGFGLIDVLLEQS
ncbi:MAG TPA: serine hydrolase domain-containing protein [Solirubrobacteraceae bacterium]|nr:serine hydrolase domain-containing protein [Solirubrobacteraceae bacterium]